MITKNKFFPDFVSIEEIESKIANLMPKAKYDFGFIQDGSLCLILRDSDSIIIDRDGSLSWKASVQTFTAHAFIKLTTGETKKKTTFIPICLLHPKTRVFARALIATTVKPNNGRYGSKLGELYIGTSTDRVFKIEFDLMPLIMDYHTLEICHNELAEQLKLKSCPFCRELNEFR